MKHTQWKICLLLILCYSGIARAQSYTVPIASPVNACIGSFTNASTPTATGIVYYWSVTPQGMVTTTNPSNSANFQWVTAGTATITVVGEDSLGNPVDSGIATVTINPRLNPLITSQYRVACQTLDSSIRDSSMVGPTPNMFLDNANGCIKVCDSTVVNYTANDPAAVSFNWSVTGGVILGSNTSATVTVFWGSPGGGSITLSDTSAAGCVGVTTICFDIIQKPHAAFAIAPNTVPASTYSGCLKTPLIFINQSTADIGSPIVSTSWSFGDGSFSSDNNPTHNYATSGTYTVDLIVKNACGCADTFETEVDISDLKGPDITCASVVCENDTASYHTSAGCAGAVYNWSVVGGTIIAGAGTADITVQWSPTASGYGYVSLAVTGCVICPDTTTVKIPIVESAPIVSGPTSPICVNTQVQYSIPLWPGVQYHWGVIGDPGAIISEHESNVITLDFTAGGSYTVHVWWQSRTNLCGGDKKFKVIVRDQAVISGPTELCTGASPVYSIIPSVSADWLVTGPGGISLSGTGTTFTPPPPPVSGIYILNASGSGICTPDPLTITVQPIPPAPDSITGPAIVCYGQPYTYNAYAPTTGSNFLWTITPAGSGTLSSTTGNSVIVTWTAPGVISVARQGTAAPYCTGNTLAINVAPYTLNPIVTGVNSVCANTTQNYSDNYTTADYTNWTIYPNTAGSVVSGEYDPNCTVLWNNTSTPITALLIATIHQCDSVRADTLRVSITPDPGVTINCSPVPPICNGTTVTLTATAGAGLYTWNFGDGTIGSSTSNTISHYYGTTLASTSPVTDVVSVIASGNGGSTCPPLGNATYNVSVYPGPNVTIGTSDPLFYCSGSTIHTTFTATVTNIVGPVTYQWYNGITPISGAVSSAYIASATGDYWVQVTDGGIAISCPVASNHLSLITSSCTIVCGGPAIAITYTQSCGTFSLSGSTTGTSPNWVASSGFSGFSTSGYTASITYPKIGIYHVQLTESFAPCLSVAEVQLTVPLKAGFTSSFDCHLTPVLTLTDTSNVMAGYAVASVSWNVVGFGTYTGSSVTVAGLTPGSSYTVIETITVTGEIGAVTCTSTQTINDPAVSVDFTDALNPSCEGIPVAFTEVLSGVTVAGTHWDFGDGSDVYYSDPSRSYLYHTVTPPSTTFPVTLSIISDNGCTYSATHSVTIFDNDLSGGVSGSDPIVTCGAPVSLSYIPVSGGTPVTYNWSNGPATATDVVTSSGSYFVQVFDSHMCRFVTDPRSVIILPQPVLNITGRVSYCENDVVQLSDFVGSDYTYQWYRNGIAISGATSADLSDPGLPNGTYTYTLEVTHSYIAGGVPTSCTYTSPGLVVTINPLPTDPFVYTMSASCSPYQVQLAASSSIPGATYTWSNGASGPTAYFNAGGAVRTWLTDMNGCVSHTDTYIPVSPESLSDWLPTGCYDYCENFIDAHGLVLYGPPGSFAYWQWLMNGSATLSGVGTVAPLTITAAGDYSLNLNTGICNSIIGNMNVTEKPCQCPSLLKGETIKCDAVVNAAGYLVTFFFNNPFSFSVDATIGTDIGPLYVMPISIPPGVSGPVTYSFTTLDVPPPAATNGWLHYYYPGGDCYEQFKLQLPSCTWAAERQSGVTETPAEAKVSVSMLVYPNPAGNDVTINYNYGQTNNSATRNIVIYDLYGRMIVSQSAANITGSFKVPLNDLASGTYLVRMEENGNTVQLQHLSITH